MNDSAFPARARCAAHGLAAAPDGTCVRCRRGAGQVASRRVVAHFAFGVGLVIALLVGYKVTMAVARMRAEQGARESFRPPPAPSAETSTPREVEPAQIPRPEVTIAWTAQPPTRAEAIPSAAIHPSEAAAEHEQALKSAMGRVDVVVYTTSWCPACKQARSWMNANGISYNERDVDQDRDAHEKLKRITGATTIPTFDIEGQVHVGLSPSWVQATIRNVAERRLARDNL
jgi:glutaredoxin 3